MCIAGLFTPDKLLYTWEGACAFERAAESTSYSIYVYMGTGETFLGDVSLLGLFYSLILTLGAVHIKQQAPVSGVKSGRSLFLTLRCMCTCCGCSAHV